MKFRPSTWPTSLPTSDFQFSFLAIIQMLPQVGLFRDKDVVSFPRAMIYKFYQNI